MLRRAATLLALVFFSTAAQALPAIGQPAPDFTATDVLTGHKITLADMRGKPVVLEWNNFDCPFVKKHYAIGAMQQLQASAAKSGVVWITINSSAAGKEGYLKDAETAKQAIFAHNAQPEYYALDHDGTIGHLYGAKSTPTMYVIDAHGMLAYMGAVDNKPTGDTADIASATNYVTQALQELKAGQPVKVASTQSYGCAVKY
jgi:hypothetical protein